MTPKSELKDLATFGGEAAFSEPLHVGRPNIGDRQRLMARLNQMLDSRWLTNEGPFVEEFEEGIREVTGALHAVAMCNATVGLEILMRALGLEGEVIVPSFTFVATAHAVRWVGLTPVFCDIDDERLTIDPAKVEELITSRTSAILGVHVYGRPCEADRLAEIAQRNGLALLFDAAHAFGCAVGATRVGTMGDAEVFSFHATKFVNSFEGGAVVTNDGELADKLRLLRNFGFAEYDMTASDGTNGKLSEAAAAMGVTSLEAMPEIIDTNRRNMAAYAAGLEGIDGIRLLMPPQGTVTNFQYVVVRVDHDRFGLDRDSLQRVLVAENVLARRYFYPGAHRMEPYVSMSQASGYHLPVTEGVTQEVLALPTGTAVETADVKAICELIRFCNDNASAIADRQAAAPAIARV